MIKSGIPLAEALEALEEQGEGPVKKVVKGLLNGVKNGQTLERSMGKYPNVFDKLYLSIVKIGEESGNLDGNLEFLSKQLGKSYEFQKKVKGAMLYPTFILGAAVIMGGAIALFVLPQLVTLFESLDVELPLATKILMWVANLMKFHGYLVMGGLIGGMVGLWGMSRVPAIRPIIDKTLLFLPVIGPFIAQEQTASFCRNLGLMLKSGLPISAAMKTSIEATENTVFRGYIKRLAAAIEKGKSMEAELGGGKYRYIPFLVGKMIGVGEKTGKLDDSLMYLADFFEEAVDDTTKNLSTIIEPVLLIGLAAMVAFLALAIISPIYQFTSSVQAT